jgi:hypothetical protein
MVSVAGLASSALQPRRLAITAAAAGWTRVSDRSPVLEHAQNLCDSGQAFLMVLSLEFEPTGNPLWIADAMLREKAQGQQIGSP